MGGLVEELAKHRIVGFDTSILVYHIEQSPRYARLAGDALGMLRTGSCLGVTSLVTLIELTVKPLRMGRPEAAKEYEAVITSLPNFELLAFDRLGARKAAALRADHNLRTPDALQIAACLVRGATAFLTNDRRLRRVTDLDVLVLEEFLSSGGPVKP